MTIMLSAEIEARIRAEASLRGIRADELVEELIDSALPKRVETHPNQSSIAILDEWEAETTTDDPEEIARRQAEFDEFKRELNETRRMTDGPHARIPFP